MEISSEDLTTQTRKTFETSLNGHGYSFQECLIKKVHDLFPFDKPGWQFQAREFPVEVRSKQTRIDFILQWAEAFPPLKDKSNIYMLAECKRSNPAYSNWCFAKSKFSSNRPPNKEHKDSLIFDAIEGTRAWFREQPYNNKDTYHISIPIKGNKSGNATSGDSGKDAIEAAASQICIGLNGFIHSLAKQQAVSKRAILIPVIFTTANLWESNADLSLADLNTGNLDFNEHDFRQVPWLIYQYALSPGIKHEIVSDSGIKSSLFGIMQAQYIRSVYIVSSSGIEDFFDYAKSEGTGSILQLREKLSFLIE